ncbi:homoserine kinase-like [Cornus florida]|uniref:homoserine kinase-like n=1 Tax=Cornus florida TaxID=4283 RepID=UPI0028982A16|nr:homoserine kinase-like [Cornus florida]
MAISLYVNVYTMTVPSTDLSKIKNSPAPFKRHLFILNFKVSFSSSPPKFPSTPPSFVRLASTSQTEPAPLYKLVTCIASPSLANFGSGFELIGCIFSGSSDMVTVTAIIKSGKVFVTNIVPVVKGGKVFVTNIVSIEVKDLHMLKEPLNYLTAFASRSGVNSNHGRVSSVAVNELFSAPLPRSELVPLIIGSETKVSNYSYNVAASISGGFVIVGANDHVGFGKTILYDSPVKVFVIPGWKSIKKVAIKAEAYGCSTAAMGLMMVAVTDCFAKGELIGMKMSKECEKQGTKVTFKEVRTLKQNGTVVINDDPPSV